jgi:hypothetical protein
MVAAHLQQSVAGLAGDGVSYLASAVVPVRVSLAKVVPAVRESGTQRLLPGIAVTSAVAMSAAERTDVVNCRL